MGILDFLFDDPAARSSLPADALPGAPSRSSFRGATPSWHPARRPVAGGHPHGDLRHGLLLGRERGFWKIPRVVTTAVGYAGGSTPNPTYGRSAAAEPGHAEVVRVAYDPERVSLGSLLRAFWKRTTRPGDAPGQRQGHQYRSAIFVTIPPSCAGRGVADRVPGAARCGRLGSITTEIALAGPFYFAEDYHQQYLDKNPSGYDHAAEGSCVFASHRSLLRRASDRAAP